MTDRRSQLLDATITVIARRGVRGLRVQEVAAEAGVSVPLIYHYFDSRDGLLEAALYAASEHADRYTTQSVGEGLGPTEQLRARLLGEFRDDETVRTTSSAWGELRWASVFEQGLRPAVHKLTLEWVEEIAELIDQALPGADAGSGQTRRSAERLVSLVEGLSSRWLSGSVSAEKARHLVEEALSLELARGSALR